MRSTSSHMLMPWTDASKQQKGTLNENQAVVNPNHSSQDSVLRRTQAGGCRHFQRSISTTDHHLGKQDLSFTWILSRIFKRSCKQGQKQRHIWTSGAQDLLWRDSGCSEHKYPSVHCAAPAALVKDCEPWRADTDRKIEEYRNSNNVPLVLKTSSESKEQATVYEDTQT